MPAVSVVIPTHNRSALLREAIDSVLAQTYTDFEIIVVDDGSTDDTASLVQAMDDPRVRYLYQEHGERSAARNRGMAAAQGEYVAFLDDDDLYLPHKLACEVAYLQAHPQVGLLGSGTQLVDGHGHVRTTLKPWLDQPLPTLLNCLFTCSLLIPSSTIFRHSALSVMDHWFDGGVDMAEDSDFFIRLVLAGGTMSWLAEVVTSYRLPLTARTAAFMVDYNRVRHRMLDKIFARPDLPPEVATQRKDIFLRFRLAWACNAYAAGMTKLGQRELLHALALAPTLAREDAPLLIQSVAGAPVSFMSTAESSVYIDYVFAHLPAPLSHLENKRDEALAVYRSLTSTLMAEALP